MRNSFLKLSAIESSIAVLFFIAFCFYFIPSADHEIRIHDTFDGNFSTRHVLINSGHFFDLNPNSIVPGIMNGLPRGVFPRFTEITTVLMFVFGSLNGFAISFLVIRFLAFLGIFLFGRDHLYVKSDQKGLLTMLAVAFACLPFFSIHGLTVAGIPILLWAFFNIYKKQKAGISYLIFALFVVWSNFVLVGFHIAFCLGAIAVWFSIKKKKIQFPLFLVIFFMIILYVLSDYMLFYMHYANTDYRSSRGEFEKILGLNVNGVIGGTVKSFFTGDYSTAHYFGFIFIPGFVYFLFKFKKHKKEELFRMGMLFMAVTALSAFFINLLDWKGFSFFYEKISFAKVFNFKRFTSILPGLFFISALVSLMIMNRKEILWLRYSSSVLIVILFFFLWRGNISYNRSSFDMVGLEIFSNQQTTFNEFFEPELYRKIKKELGSDSINNVIHFGLSASPSKYAGLKVLDDYQGDYPMEYKEQFRKIIEGELNKSESLRSYFDKWGSRCYMESAGTFENRLEQRYGFRYQSELSINTQQLKAMNCNYILSSVLIGNSSQLSLRLQKILVSATTRKTVLLYKVI